MKHDTKKKQVKIFRQQKRKQPAVQCRVKPATEQPQMQQDAQVSTEQIAEEEDRPSTTILPQQSNKGKQMVKTHGNIYQKGILSDSTLETLLKKNRYSPLRIQDDNNTDKVVEEISLHEENLT